MISKTIIAGLVAIAFVAGSVMTGTMTYAAPGDKGQPFEALQLQIDALQLQITELTFTQTEPDEPVIEIITNPAATESPLIVKDTAGNALFQVLPNGAIQLGSSTVIYDPDGSVGPDPIFIQAGSTIDGNPIASNADINALENALFGDFSIDAGVGGQVDTAVFHNATAVKCTFDLDGTVTGMLTANNIFIVWVASTPLVEQQIEDDRLPNTSVTAIFDERIITVPPSTPVLVETNLFHFGNPFLQDTVSNTCIVP